MKAWTVGWLIVWYCVLAGIPLMATSFVPSKSWAWWAYLVLGLADSVVYSVLVFHWYFWHERDASDYHDTYPVGNCIWCSPKAR